MECRYCSKPIPKNNTFCDRECSLRYVSHQKAVDSMLPVIKGGSTSDHERKLQTKFIKGLSKKKLKDNFPITGGAI